jgi:rhomboid protease GluP
MDSRRMCPNCRAFITADDKTCPYCQASVGPRAIERRTPADALGGLIPHARFTTMVILLINTGLYVATVLYSYKTNGGGLNFDLDTLTLVLFGAKSPRIYVDGEWWRLITAGFLHGGIMHILMNSWVLFDVGAQVEETFGTSRYLVAYFVSTITGYLASLWWAPAVPSIGASAAIMGLVGAMIAHSVRDRSSYGVAVRKMYTRWVIYILIFGLLPFFNIDNAAHIGGLAGGFAVGYVAGTPGFSRTLEGFWRAASGVALAITALAFAEMFLFLMAHSR